MTAQNITSGAVLYVVSADELRQVVADAVRDAVAQVAPADPFLPEYLNQSELARLLRCSSEHIRQLERRGELASIRDGGQKLFSREVVTAFLRRRLEGRS